MIALGRLLAAGDPATLIAGGLLLLVAALAASLYLARRERRQEVRAIVQTVEELRSGQQPRRPTVDSRSPLALISDAVQRLGHDLSVRWREVEEAGQRLDAVMDAVHDIAVISTDREADIQTMSPGAAELFGWDARELAGRPVEVLFGESWKEFLPRLAPRSLPDGGIDVRVPMTRKEGELFDAQVDVRTLRGRGGEPAGFVMVVRDVSAQVRLERDLRASEARYRSLVEGLGVGVFLQTRGRIVYANPALATLCGVDVEGMHGRPWRDWVASRDVLLVQERLEELERRGEGALELHVTLAPVGAALPRRVLLRAQAIGHGDEPAVLATVEDETAEERVRHELLRNENRLDALLESSADGVLVLARTPEGGVVHLTNHAFLERFGLGEREVLGASEGALLRLLRECGEGAEEVAALLAAATGERRTESVRLGGPRPAELEVTVQDLADRSGARLGRVLVVRDLSRQRASEEEMRARADELLESKASLEQAYQELSELNAELTLRGQKLGQINDELRSLDRMKSDLLGNVTHELQTPLVSVRGYTEMILKGRLGSITDEQRKGLELSLKNIDRMISMIDSLLAIPRAGAEIGPMRPRVFELRPVIEECVETLRERIEARRIDLGLGFDSPRARVRGDRDMVLRVFLNVVGNAIKFNREGGRVEIAVREGREGTLRVEVRDTGVGIPADDLERIFDRGYRGRGGERAEGAGLGLSMVRQILRLHGCSIRAESEPGRWTVFSFTLPAAEEERRSGDERPPDEPGPDRPESGGPVAGDDAPAAPPRRRLRIIRRNGGSGS